MAEKTAPAAPVKAAQSAPAKAAETKTRKPPVRKVLTPLDFDKIEVKVATPDVMRQFRRTRGPRDPEQRAVDNLILRAHEKWIADGRPESWVETAGLYIKVPVDQFETIESRARRAGAFYDLAIRFSNRVDKDGYAEVVLVAKDKPVKDESDDNGETA